MNILFYFTSFIPLLCLLGAGMVLANDICPEQKTLELKQACLDDAIWLGVIGMIISVAISSVVFVSRLKNPDTPQQSYPSVEDEKK